MAVYREQPKCPNCGKYIKSIYHDYSDLPLMMRPIGDSFIRWDWEGHNKICKNPKPLPHIAPTGDEDIDNFTNLLRKLKITKTMEQAIVELTVDSTTQRASGNTEHPTQHEIHCNLPYGQDNVFFRMSGGTTLSLLTINDNAAKIFKSGKKVRLTIEAVED